MEQYKEILYPLVSHANALMTISHENPILRDFWGVLPIAENLQHYQHLKAPLEVINS